MTKLLLTEEGSVQAADLWLAADRVVASFLTYAETRSALGSALRSGRISHRRHRAAKEELDGYWQSVYVVDLTDGVARLAGEMSERFAVSAADAVHLATAMIPGDSDLVFASWDQKLAAAAHSVGLLVSPSVE